MATRAFVTRHRIHTSDLFSHQSLVELLDRYPRDKLQVFTMGQDPKQWGEWKPVDTSGANGRDIMHAVAVGRLWVKLIRLDLADAAIGEYVARLYDEIAEKSNGFKPLWLRPLLLISSPSAMVYYHVDAAATMLWQLAGAKRVWIYPADDEELVSPRSLEGVYSGETDEEVPYREEYDRRAEYFDLNPGDLLSWPLHSPHRVVNHDSVNVSLSVPYGTEKAELRRQIHMANWFFRNRLGLELRSTRERGAATFLKRAVYSLAFKAGLATERSKGTRYMTDLRIDGASPTGVSVIRDGPVATPF